MPISTVATAVATKSVIPWVHNGYSEDKLFVLPKSPWLGLVFEKIGSEEGQAHGEPISGYLWPQILLSAPSQSSGKSLKVQEKGRERER